MFTMNEYSESPFTDLNKMIILFEYLDLVIIIIIDSFYLLNLLIQCKT